MKRTYKAKSVRVNELIQKGVQYLAHLDGKPFTASAFALHVGLSKGGVVAHFGSMYNLMIRIRDEAKKQGYSDAEMVADCWIEYREKMAQRKMLNEQRKAG